VLVTDSTAYLGTLAAELSVTVVPLHVSLGEWTFAEPTVEPARFYERLSEGGRPTTSQPSPGAFLEVFETADEPVLCLTCSATLSGTHESATLAAGMASQRVDVVDTGTMSGGLALVVATVARSGLPHDEAVALAQSLVGRVRSTWSSGSTDLLRAGGRFREELPDGLPVMALQGSALSVVGSARSVRESVELQAAQVLASTAEHPSYVTVGHGDVAGAADVLADALQGKPGVLGVDRYIIGPVVGAHTGAGTFGANYVTGAPS
jgi:DegV family protein with EDD domain